MASPTMRSTGLVNDSAGLVDWNVKHTDSIGGQEFACAWDRDVVLLPANAADPQPENFVVAKAGKEPG